MQLRRLLPRLPTRPWRLLRQGVRTLERIAGALEEQNALMRALNPDAVQRMHQPDVVESGVSYVDDVQVARAERLRAQHYYDTGRVLDDEQLLSYLMTEGDIRQ